MPIPQTHVTLRSAIGTPFVSERGAELFCDGVADRPVITVENYLKWYDLYVIHPEGRVEVLEDHLSAEDDFISEYGESAYGDHVFNPRFVLFLARRNGMDVSSGALEALIGRWQLEHDNVDFNKPRPK